MTYAELQTAALRRAKMLGDTDAAATIAAELIIGARQVARYIKPKQLITAVDITVSAGDEALSLPADCNYIEQVRITSPVNYASVIPMMKKEDFRGMNPTTEDDENNLPGIWYWLEPTLNTNNVPTKRIGIYPAADSDYTVTISYGKFPTNLTNPDDVPFFNENFHDILIDFALWKFAERETDAGLNPMYYQEQWEYGLEQLIAYDKEDDEVLLPIARVNNLCGDN